MCVGVRWKKIPGCILQTDLFVLIIMKGNIMKATKHLMTMCAAGMMVVALAACQKKDDMSTKGPAETAGAQIDATAAKAEADIKAAAANADAKMDQASANTSAKMDQVGAEASQKMNEAADAVGKKVEHAGEKIQESANK